MLYPIQNNYRDVIDLSGLWKFKTDPADDGESNRWFEGFKSDIDIAIPGSWNEQLEELGLLHYVGSAWFSKKVFIPKYLEGKNILLRVGSADYCSEIWINGKLVGENHIGFLPFEFVINQFVQTGENADIVIRVNNQLSHESIPQGITSEQYEIESRLREETFPPARFDFSPFGGIHRAVQIVTTPLSFIEKIKVDTECLQNKAIVKVSVSIKGTGNTAVAVILQGEKNTLTTDTGLVDNVVNCSIEVVGCRFWSPEDPFLYDLMIQLKNEKGITDEYTLPIGIREIKIIDNQLLLNGKPLYLKGFGKHEDAPVIGKGLFLPLMVKDFELMKWIGANSFRTSHYPYAEEIMSYADRKGIIVIDEVPAVSLDLRWTNGKTLKHHKEYIQRLFDRDYNHPSVLIWALGNEPNLVGESGYGKGSGKQYWEEIFAHARSLDSTRPMIVPNCLRAGIEDPVLELSDIVTINRYYGWYEYPGRLQHAMTVLEDELEQLHKKYNKPIMMTEFGADTIPGLHSTSDQMFTEEYQDKMLTLYINLLHSKKYVVGEHVWNFADFRTPQNLRRVLLNMKGVFTRTRSPKLAAFTLKKLWNDPHLGLK